MIISYDVCIMMKIGDTVYCYTDCYIDVFGSKILSLKSGNFYKLSSSLNSSFNFGIIDESGQIHNMTIFYAKYFLISIKEYRLKKLERLKYV